MIFCVYWPTSICLEKQVSKLIAAVLQMDSESRLLNNLWLLCDSAPHDASYIFNWTLL